MAPTKEEVGALLAEAVKELAALPDEDVRHVLQAATQQFWKAASGATEFAAVQVALAEGVMGGRTVLAGGLTVAALDAVAAAVAGAGEATNAETVAALDAVEAAVASPAFRRQLAELRKWVPDRKDVVNAILGALAGYCLGRLGGAPPTVSQVTNVQQVVVVCPPPAPAVPSGPAPEPPPLLKKP